MWIDWHCEEAVYVYNNLVATLKWLAGGGLEEWRSGAVEAWLGGHAIDPSITLMHRRYHERHNTPLGADTSLHLHFSSTSFTSLRLSDLVRS